ncbi:MAG: hypothetical protein ABUS57_07430 [Pseudomonadota bacterium]
MRLGLEAARRATPDQVRLDNEAAAKLNRCWWEEDIKLAEDCSGLSLSHWLSPHDSP